MRARGTPRPQAARAAMGIQGMELCAMAVVVLLFIAVLKQFGILEPMSMEGNAWPPAPWRPCAGGRRSEGREQHLRSGVRVPRSTRRGAALGDAVLRGPARLGHRPLLAPEITFPVLISVKGDN